jgi:hypothetical protein
MMDSEVWQGMLAVDRSGVPLARRRSTIFSKERAGASRSIQSKSSAWLAHGFPLGQLCMSAVRLFVGERFAFIHTGTRVAACSATKERTNG